MGDERIIVAPATAKALSSESEGYAGNAYDDWSELRYFERVRRLRRLEDSERAARELGDIANAAGNHRAGGRIDARIENRAAEAQRLGPDLAAGNFVLFGCLENDC